MKRKSSKFRRSTRTSLKFANDSKLKTLDAMVDEYNLLLNKFIEYYWAMDSDSLPKYCSAPDYNLFPSTLGSFLTQCAGKQALGVVRGTVAKQKQRLFKYRELLGAEKFKQARKLKRLIDETAVSCPTFDGPVPMEVGGNRGAFKIDLDSETLFDGWLTFTFQKLDLPFKRTKHFNELVRRGGRLSLGARVSKTEVSFCFTFDRVEKTEGEVLGIDIGVKNVVTCSDGQQSELDELTKVLKKLNRRKLGSRRFRQTLQERDNLVNRAIKKLDLDGVREVRREDIKYLRKGKKTSKLLKHWTYADVLTKLDRYCEERNVSVTRVPPAYTS